MNSRNKGNRGERDIAKLLSDWTGKKFSRTPSSGGLQWKKDNVKGDITSTEEGFYFPFCVEVKFHKKIDFSHLITPGIKNIDILDFWKQCYRDASLCNKIPLLFMRYNGLPKDFWFTVIPKDLYYYCIEPFYDKEDRAIGYNGLIDNFYIIPISRLLNLPYKKLHPIFKNYAKNIQEIIKPLSLGDGNYLISNRGYIINKSTGNKDYGLLDGSGALFTYVEHKGKGKRIRIYREVAKTFVKNPKNKPQVHHIRPIRRIGDARNLIWGTPSENNIHRWENNEPGFRIQKVDIETKKVLGEYLTCMAAAKSMGKGRKEAKQISRVLRGLRKTAYKFNWVKKTI